MNKLSILFFSLSLVCSCAVWPIGHDPKGKELREQADMILSIIKKYKNDNGRFPATIADLVPGYFDELPEVAKDSSYLPENGFYSFSYIPSWPQAGIVTCSKALVDGEWHCLCAI